MVLMYRKLLADANMDVRARLWWLMIWLDRELCTFDTAGRGPCILHATYLTGIELLTLSWEGLSAKSDIIFANIK